MPAGKSKENKGIHRGSVRQESKIPYDKIYENKFGRKVPFPRLDVRSIKVNPIDTSYFYITKTQILDEKFKIDVYVTTEDKEDIEEEMKNLDVVDEDDDRQTKFDKAIEYMRISKHTLDLDGKLKNNNKVSIQERGTKSNQGVFGGIGRELTKQLFENEGSDSDSEDSQVPSSSSEEEKEGGSKSSEKDSSQSQVSDSSAREGGVSSSKPSASEPDSEELKVNNSSSGENQGLTHTNTNGKLSNDRNSKNIKVEKASDNGIDEKILLKPMKSNRRDAQAAPEKTYKEIDEMNQEAMKEEEKEDEGQEKEEEEKYTVEYVPFQKITMKGAKNSFKDKAKILMCCKFTPLGYNVEHKIYSRVDDLDERDFKFSDDIVFSSCGKYFLTYMTDVSLYAVIYNAKTLVEENRFTINNPSGDKTWASLKNLMLSKNYKLLCVQYGEQYYIYNAKSNGKKLASLSDHEGIVFTQFKNEYLLIGRGFKKNSDSELQTSVIYTYDVSSGRSDKKSEKAFDDYYYSIVINNNGDA